MTVPSIKLLRDRCIEVGDCLIWQQGCSGAGAPIISLSKEDRARAVRPIAYRLMRGEIPEGHFVFVLCGDKRCISPVCMRCGTKGDYMRAAGQRGAYSTPKARAARARNARERSPRTIETARAIREARAGGALLRELAAEHDIAIDTVCKIVNGRIWREGAANSSVFGGAMRPAA